MAASESNLRFVLQAAGQGKRMKSNKCKVLHEVLGRPILWRILQAVDAVMPEHIHIVIGHEAEQIEQFLRDHPPKTPYSLHLQKPQLGTGHALQQVMPGLEGFKGTLVVAAADVPMLTPATFSRMIEHHRKLQASVTVLTADVDDPKNYGRIVRDANQQVVGITEHKDCTEEERKIKEVNTANYCFEWPAILDGVKTLSNDNQQKEYYLTDVVGWAYRQKLPTTAISVLDWREMIGINSRLELAEANQLMRDMKVRELALDGGVTIIDPLSTWIAPEVKVGQDSVIYPGCILFGDVEIGSNCSIGPHSSITGKVKIGDGSSILQSHVANTSLGKNCRVGPFAHLRDGNDIADNVRLGNFVEIKKAFIGNKTNVSHLSYVGDAEIGSGSNLGAGTILANYNHATKKKSRTKIGDNASTGSNSVLVAPISIGDGASVAAGTVATKDVPAGALAVGRVRQENKLGWSERHKDDTKGSNGNH